MYGKGTKILELKVGVGTLKSQSLFNTTYKKLIQKRSKTMYIVFERPQPIKYIEDSIDDNSSSLT